MSSHLRYLLSDTEGHVMAVQKISFKTQDYLKCCHILSICNVLDWVLPGGSCLGEGEQPEWSAWGAPYWDTAVKHSCKQA